MEPATDGSTADNSVTTEEGRFNRSDLLLGAGGAAAALGLTLPGLAQARQFRSFVDEAAITNLRWSMAGAPASFDIATNFSGDAMYGMYLTYETLVNYSPKLELVPFLASSVSNPTPTKYIYTLRPGIKFSDGSPVTADDVVYSIQRNVNPKLGSQVQSYFPSVKRVAKTGPNEVTVTLKQVDPLYKYALVYAPIIPKKFAKSKGKKLGAQGSGNWISTGPYMVKSFTGDKLVLVRNPHYWGQKPATAQITFSWISDPQTLQLAMRSGQIDGTFAVNLPDIPQWKTIPNVKLSSAPALRSWWLSFDLTTAPWSDLHVRKAFAYALNKRGIIDSILHGAGQPSNGIVPPGQWGGLLDAAGRKKLYASIPTYTYDLNKAKAELAQSSVPNGFSASLSIPASRTYVVDAMLAFAADLKKLGITLDVKSVPNSQWLATIYAHKDLGVQFLGFGPDYPDPANYIVLSYPSANAVPNNFNTANYKSPQVDSLLEKQRTAKTDAQRVKDIGDIMKISQADLPYLFLWWEDFAMALQDKLSFAGLNAFTYFTPWADRVKAK
ncbi:MAG: peptide/nickel transport system substrate-binding protein [Gaiellales bacterium]|jgi:peptide/nickel transport system substrate-binding protein|nr:peptide/nickel transport system substrate-binding protein [Gaiellales bacterium]